MKKIFLFTCYFFFLPGSRAQVIVNLQLPPVGLSAKNQLWNLSLINSGDATIKVRLKMILVDIATGGQVLSGTSNTFLLPRGPKLLSFNDVLPVNYILLNSSYGIDASPVGLLPVGNFSICFEVEKIESDVMESITEECASIQVEPLSPPYLSLPQDQSVTDTKSPAFSWIPPAPLNLFSNLSYNLKLVEVFANQDADDAIQQNLPLISIPYLRTNSCPYPASNAVLDTGKLYAWQVIANNNNLFVANSEVWTFKVQAAEPLIPVNRTPPPYFRLNTDKTAGYFICNGILRFEYFNELNDNIATIKIYDINHHNRIAVDIGIENISLRYGQNLISIDISNAGGIKTGQMYSIELSNSNKENWKGQFEFKRIN